MTIARIITAICFLFFFAVASCASPNAEYYLNKDATHKDVYSIIASISSDGTCSFSVDGDEAGKYGELYWSDTQDLKTIEQTSKAFGFCEEVHGDPSTDTDHVPVPYMFLTIIVPGDLESAELNSGLSLDVLPAALETLDMPPSVIFSISSAKNVKKYMFSPCGTEVVSLSGEAYLESKADGEIALNIIALGYPRREGC